MSRRLLGMLLVGILSATDHAQARRGVDLPAYYDVETGNLTIDTTNVIGGVSIGYVISPGVFRPENFTPFMNTPFINASNRSVGESNFQGVPGGVYSLGDILLPGLTEQELIDIYFGPDNWGNPSGAGKRAYYVSGGLGEDTLHILKPVYAPSPYPAINDPNDSSDPVDRWATSATVLYDPLDGGLTLDTTGESGGAIWIYELTLNEPSSFDLNAFTPVVSELKPSAEDDTIVETGFGWIDEGVYPLGAILPPGLSESELVSMVDQFQFLGEPGHSAESLDIANSGVDFSISVVPEPGVNVFALAIVFLAFRQCRRSLASSD